MADIRCPTCGKYNPDNKVICEYCDSILVSADELNSGSSDDLMSLLGSDPEEDVPDWLQELRPEDEEQEVPPQDLAQTPTEAAEDTTLDWLGTEIPAESSQEELAEGDDWISRLDDSAAAFKTGDEDFPSLSPTDPGAELEAWLSRDADDAGSWDLELSLDEFSDSSSQEKQPEESESLPAGAIDDTLDWLSSLDQDGEQLQSEETGTKTSHADEGDLDWLDAQEGIPSAGEEQSLPGELDDEAQDWLAGLTGVGAALASSDDAENDQPDWLSSLGTEDASLDEELSPDQLIKQAEEPEDQSLDFPFDELGQPEEAEDLTFDTEQPAEQPDWLASLGNAVEEPDIEVQADIFSVEDETLKPVGEPSDTGAEEMPDWFSESLSEIGMEQSAAEQTSVSPFTTGEFEEGMEISEQPDWFNSLQEDSETSVQNVHRDEDIPDWLQQAGEGESPFGAVASNEGRIPVESESQFSTLDETDIGADTPDWLGDLEPQPDQEPAALEEEFGEANFASMNMQEGEAVPDWLARLDMNETQAAEESSIPAFISEVGSSSFEVDESPSQELPPELQPEPDWLDQIGSQDLAPIEAAQEVEADTGLEPAELPGWLEAMRPGDTSKTAGPYQDTSDERIEAAGMLSGLAGILPGSYELNRATKPAVYSIKLHIPQDQQDRVDLLKQMLEDEVQDILPPTPAAIPTTYILRLLILGAFILGAVFAFVAGVQQTPVPGAGSIPAELLDLRRTLDELPNGVPVLVAFDYQAATLPELETAALPVIDQLFLKGALIRTVSTNNSGPLLAQHILERASSMPDRQQLPPPDFANLGYIPGGAAGLQAFVRDPAAVMRYDLTDTESGSLDAWQPPAFNPADGIANFQLVLVITDSADTARSWIEQSGPSLQENDIPLIMVVSAQAEPMVRPYYTSTPRQVSGFASGLMGGVFLESLAGRAGSARLYLDAYSLTLMVAVFLLVIGSLVNLVTGQILGSKPTTGEGKAQ